jgi:hypothetical protein
MFTEEDEEASSTDDDTSHFNRIEVQAVIKSSTRKSNSSKRTRHLSRTPPSDKNPTYNASIDTSNNATFPKNAQANTADILPQPSMDKHNDA